VVVELRLGKESARDDGGLGARRVVLRGIEPRGVGTRITRRDECEC
jgi:hypothetical protein